MAALFGLGVIFDVFDHADVRLRQWQDLDKAVAAVFLLVVGLGALTLRRSLQVERERDLRRDSERRLRALVEGSPTVTYSWDVDGERFAYVSPQLQTLLGIDPLDWVRDPTLWRAAIHHEERDRIAATAARGGETEVDFDETYRLVGADGKVVWVRDVWIAPPRGTKEPVPGVMIDVTRQKVAEREAAATEARYRTIVEQVPAVTYIWDGADQPGTVAAAYISPQIEWLLGYTPQQWLEEPEQWGRRVHGDDLQRVLDAWESSVQTMTPFAEEYRIRRPDGSWVWLRDEATPIATGDRGEPLYQGVMFDITERKEAEERLRQAEERYRVLVEQLPVAVYTDADDDIATALYISPRYEQLTGYSPAERLADPSLWVHMLHPDDHDWVLAESDRLSEAGLPFDLEYRVIAKDGRVVWLHDESVLVVDDEGRRVWQGVLQDVTESRVAQEALARRDELLQAAGMAAERLLGSTSWQEAFRDVLPRLGASMGSSRAYLYENRRTDDGSEGVVMLQDWRADGTTARAMPDVFAWRDGGFGRWVDVLSTGAPLAGLVRDLPESERQYLEPRGIASLLAIPIMVDDHWWGYVGFDADDERLWHEAEIDALTVTANTVAAAIGRESTAHDLADAQNRYRSLVEQMPAVTYMETAGGELLYASPQITDLTGYDPSEWGENYRRIVHPDDAARFEAEATASMTGVEYHSEYRVIHRDGRVVWVRDDAVLVTSDDGAPYWQGVMVDVTAEKDAEERLREAEERYRGIVEHVPAAIYLDRAGTDMETVYISPQITAIAGVTPTRWMSEPDLWLRLMHPDDRDALEAGYMAAAGRGEAWTAEYRITTPDGRTIWVHDETTPLHDADGQLTFIQGVLFDVTERKLAEQALRDSERREREAAERLRALDEMKNTFLAAVSHELRSPLTSILGLSLTLERAPDMDDADRDDLLLRLSANARKLDRLLKDLLDIDRLNRGIVEPQRRITDVGMVARMTLENLEGLAGRDVVAITDEVIMSVDPPKVERIVENLVMNTARHTHADARIWLRVEPVEGGVLIAVDDDGDGVAEDLRDVIFEPFRQGPTASPHSPGTGVGLSLVARFAELHGGRAWVTDREGGGASFCVFLPDTGGGPVVAGGQPAGSMQRRLSTNAS